MFSGCKSDMQVSIQLDLLTRINVTTQDAPAQVLSLQQSRAHTDPHATCASLVIFVSLHATFDRSHIMHAKLKMMTIVRRSLYPQIF